MRSAPNTTHGMTHKQGVQYLGMSEPTQMEFEMAYQALVAIDRIKFAIKHTEHFGPGTNPMRDAGLQLLMRFRDLKALTGGFKRDLGSGRKPRVDEAFRAKPSTGKKSGP